MGLRAARRGTASVRVPRPRVRVCSRQGAWAPLAQTWAGDSLGPVHMLHCAVCMGAASSLLTQAGVGKVQVLDADRGRRAAAIHSLGVLLLLLLLRLPLLLLLHLHRIGLRRIATSYTWLCSTAWPRRRHRRVLLLALPCEPRKWPLRWQLRRLCSHKARAFRMGYSDWHRHYDRLLARMDQRPKATRAGWLIKIGRRTQTGIKFATFVK